MLGGRLVKARKYAKFNQDLLSNKIEVSKRTLINYEQNVKEPTVSMVIKIAKYCNINDIWLLTGKGEMLLHDEQNSIQIEEKTTKSNVINGDIVGNGNNGHTINPSNFNLSAREQVLIDYFKGAKKEVQDKALALLITQDKKGEI